jgi:hypothetical protein
MLRPPIADRRSPIADRRASTGGGYPKPHWLAVVGIWVSLDQTPVARADLSVPAS